MAIKRAAMMFRGSLNSEFVRERLKLLNIWFHRLHLDTLLNSKNHASDFGEMRAQYIDSRVRLLACMFSVLTPLWIPVDFFILPDGSFVPMVGARLLFSLLLMLLWVLPSRRVTLPRARVRLILLMVLPSLFHLSTQLILGENADTDLLICYTFLPLLIIAMHSIFPLTLTEGLGLAGFTIFLLSLDEITGSTLLTVRGLGHLWLSCLIMGVAIWAQLSQLHIELKMHHQSVTDPLTGLLNRRTLMKLLKYEKDRYERHQRPFSLMLLDMDHFKQINDCHGHSIGDRVLQRFAQIMREQSRGSDILARYGGEEFVIIMPETSGREGAALARRIHQANQRYPLPLASEESLYFTVSIGVCEFSHQDSLENMLNKADAALYQAKKDGRNCTSIAG